MQNNQRLNLSDLLLVSERLNHIKDIDSLLAGILYEARTFCNADAGSIFLRNGDVLTFSYVQNDTLKKRDKNYNKNIYNNFNIKINKESVAGYVADTAQPLIINDVYEIGDDVPYSFNKHFDDMSSYHTKSMLTIPLVTSQENVTGVMQIINPKNKDGYITSFDLEDQQYVQFMGNNASVAIERAQMTREIILRMIRMAELRDPKETGAHVNRVGAYSIEIYQRYAEKKGYPEKEIRRFKDLLRIAAMLHDVGKVAISDTILKKPAKLDDDELKVMRTHCKQGTDLFKGKVSDLDMLSAEIALTHHEKFDGSGYPRKLKGEEIPLSGRIVAVADVFDALISQRAYKKRWPESEVLRFLKEQRDKHFDPEVVDAFIEVYEIIKAVQKRYPDIDHD